MVSWLPCKVLIPPSLRDENNDPLVWLASGITPRAVEFSQNLGNFSTPVDPAGKLAVTWGAIKIQQ